MRKKKVVLAYSGGLDTSVAISWLKEKRQFEVVALLVNLGQDKDLTRVKNKALKIGASSAYLVEAKEEFLTQYVYPALKAGAVYEGKYFLATALGRPLIAKKLVEVARREKADFVAHGCTGKGNDQVRFEVSLMALNPKLKVVAPLREWPMKSREETMDYAREHKIPIEQTRKFPYSIDQNLWGVSIECGILENPAQAPPEGAYQLTRSLKEAPDKAAMIEIEFKKGVPVKLNKKKLSPVKLVSELNKIGGKHSIGRSDLVENRLVGIKSREIYEAPAAKILHTVHRALEELILDRETFHFKEGLSLKYAELVYYGLWYSPLKEAMDAFIKATQKKVTGSVKLKLYKGNCEVLSRKSSFSLYKKNLATYEKGDTFDQSLAEGFIKLWGLPLKVQAEVNKKS